jgi:hypothetical protein
VRDYFFILTPPAFLQVSTMNVDRLIPVPAVLSVLQSASLSEAAPDGA